MSACTGRLLLCLCFMACHVFADGSKCFDDLGMENGMIADDQISSTRSTGAHPNSEARLNGEKAWKSDVDDPWIQVSLEQLTNVAGIATQGREDGGDEWVTRYRVEYTTTSDESTWETIANSDGNNEFIGNMDKNSIVTQNFSNVVAVLKIRINPTAANNDKVALRFELYGCDVSSTTPAPTISVTTMTTDAATSNILTSPHASLTSDNPDLSPSRDSNTGAIVGAVFGVLVLVILILVIIVFLLRRSRGTKKDNPKGVFMENVSYEGVAEPSGSAPRQGIAIQDGGLNPGLKPDNSEGMVDIYATSKDTAVSPASLSQGNGEIYHDISDKAEQSEYSYAYADVNSEDKTQSQKPNGTEYTYADVIPENVPHKSNDSAGYTYVDARITANISTDERMSDEKTEAGWKDNTLYGNDEGQPEGWKDNTVYAATESKEKDVEGWEDNVVYAADL